MTGKSKIKIAVICPGFGIIPRGIETVVKEVFYSLAECNDYTIDIYCGAEPDKINAPGNIRIRQIRMPSFNTVFTRLYKKIARCFSYPANEEFDFNFMIFALKLAPVFLTERYDLIFNNAGLFSAYLCRFVRMVYNTPYIHSGHAGINNLELALAKQKPDLYIASTEPAKDWLLKHIPHINVSIIPNGINPEIFKPYYSDEKKIGISVKMERPVYFFVGALTEQKQPVKLLNAFIKNQKGSLIIIGDGPLKNEILETARNNNLSENKFLYIEKTDYEKLADYFNFCDYFTMLSRNETFGIVYIMAIACNKPVLAENAPQQKWMLENAALYCDGTLDESQLSKKLEQLTKISFDYIPVNISKKYHGSNIVEMYKKEINKFIHFN